MNKKILFFSSNKINTVNKIHFKINYLLITLFSNIILYNQNLSNY